MEQSKLQYAIITPAYNEQQQIKKTIESVLEQSSAPSIWLVVDDGSSDQTGSIVREYSKRYSWIRCHTRTRVAGQSYYGSNVYAIQEGYEQIRTEPFKYLAILDADISLPKMYYEDLLSKFEADPKLGIASGVYLDLVHGKLRKILNDRRSTPKALMVFRRACFEDIGGLAPMKYGGEDTAACFTARMKGWKVWSFPDLTAIHNKPVGTGHGKSLVQIRFRQGIGEYFMATDPLFLILKSLRRCFLERPYVIGGIVRMIGYLCGWLKREPRQISLQLIKYIRREQMQRIYNRNQVSEVQIANRPLKICFAASAGGHMLQLLKLDHLKNEHSSVYISTSPILSNKLSSKGAFYSVGESNRQHWFSILRVFFKCMRIMRRERPDVVISTGASIGFIAGFLCKMQGGKIIWIDSITNVQKLSLSGRLIRPFADLFIVQWQHLKDRYSTAEYLGNLI